MSLWRHLTRGVRALASRKAVDCETADEVRDYLGEAADAFEAGGLSPDEARLAALREIGSPAAARERVRGYGRENAIESLLADMGYAVRRLCGNPGSSNH